MTRYRLTTLGAEYLGGNPGETVTASEVQDVWADILRENQDDILVKPTGLWLVHPGEDCLIAEPKEEA